MLTVPIKCASPTYKKAPFYTIQLNRKDKRYVAYLQDSEKMKSFILSYIEKDRDEKDGGILKHFFTTQSKGLHVSITDFKNTEKPLKYRGIVNKETLITAVEKYSTLIFTDGFHELMIWRKADEYMVIDDHGLICVYTKKDYSTKFISYGINFEENAPLIYDYAHWHIQAVNGVVDLKNLINELRLT